LGVRLQEQFNFALTNLAVSNVMQHKFFEHCSGNLATLSVIFEEKKVEHHIQVAKLAIRKLLSYFP